MRFFSFVILSVIVYNSQAPAEVNATDPTGNSASLLGAGGDTTTNNQPPMVPLECGNTYVPVSELDIYELSKQDAAKDPNAANQQPDPSKLSKEKTMAICEGTAESKAGLCDLSSCASPQPPACTKCSEVDQNSANFAIVAGATPLDKVECNAGYVLKNAQSNEPGNMCMTTDKAYSCGDCQVATACKQCVVDGNVPKTP